MLMVTLWSHSLKVSFHVSFMMPVLIIMSQHICMCCLGYQGCWTDSCPGSRRTAERTAWVATEIKVTREEGGLFWKGQASRGNTAFAAGIRRKAGMTRNKLSVWWPLVRRSRNLGVIVFFFFRSRTASSGNISRLNASKRQWLSGRWLSSTVSAWLAWRQTKIYFWGSWRQSGRRCIWWVLSWCLYCKMQPNFRSWVLKLKFASSYQTDLLCK